MIEYLRIMIAARSEKLGERGASAVEYGLLVAGIAAFIVLIVFAFGDNIRDTFEDTCKSIQTGGDAGGTCAKD